MKIKKTTRAIISVAQEIADGLPKMFSKKGPGEGNRFTNEYMKSLNARVRLEFGPNIVEQAICKGTRQNVDFFIRKEKTIIEVELSLYNVHTNLDRDIFKVLLALDDGHKIDHLILLGKEPAQARHRQPASRSLIAWVKHHHNLTVSIEDIKMQP